MLLHLVIGGGAHEAVSLNEAPPCRRCSESNETFVWTTTQSRCIFDLQLYPPAVLGDAGWMADRVPGIQGNPGSICHVTGSDASRS
jgi:hypothetical protein